MPKPEMAGSYVLFECSPVSLAKLVEFTALAFGRASLSRSPASNWRRCYQPFCRCWSFVCRCDVFIQFLRFPGRAAPGTWQEDLQDLDTAIDVDCQHIAGLDRMARFVGGLPVYPNLAACDQARCQGAGFDNAGKPEPFVEALTRIRTVILLVA